MLNTEIISLLEEKVSKENIFLDEPMKKHTTFKIGGNADVFIKTKNIEEIKFILDECKKNSIPLTIIGNGSNILVKDEGIKGIVLKIDIDNIEFLDIKEYDTLYSEYIKDASEKCVIINAGAGVALGKLAQVLLKNSISGFEFASGIPGTIGGAVRMNAGAYGKEFKDIVIETTCITYDGEIIKLSNKEQEFEYRKSIFKNNGAIILESKLLLKYVEDAQIIKEKMDEYKKSRVANQPIEFPSAGSVFKRGKDFITAKVIDECGLKGYKVGGAEVSTKHAGFIINTGNATAEDVLNLVDIIKKQVYEKQGKNIELEIEVVG